MATINAEGTPQEDMAVLDRSMEPALTQVQAAVPDEIKEPLGEMAVATVEFTDLMEESVALDKPNQDPALLAYRDEMTTITDKFENPMSTIGGYCLEKLLRWSSLVSCADPTSNKNPATSSWRGSCCWDPQGALKVTEPGELPTGAIVRFDGVIPV